MENFLRKFFPVVFSLIALGSVSWAQLPKSGNAFIGYSFSQGETFAGGIGSGSSNMNGWEGSGEAKFFPWLGFVGDFDWHYGGRDFVSCIPSSSPSSSSSSCTSQRFHVNSSRHVLLFGPRASISVGRYTPFAEFLLGIAHQSDSGGTVSNTDTTFAAGYGGGLDYKVLKGVAWRAQADSIRSHLFGKTQSDLRISTGVVFRF